MPDSTPSGPTFGWQAPISVGGVELKNASAINVALGNQTEQMDVMAAENQALYVATAHEYTISFTIKMYNAGGSAASEVAPFLAACLDGSALAISIDGVSGKFIVTKCDANREAQKVVSYSIELKQTYDSSSTDDDDDDDND